VPTRIAGILDDGGLEERVTSVVRTLVAPIPRFAARAVAVDEDNACLVVEVPPGLEPPYLFVPNGQVLIRTPTSSEPISINDRETLDRLFSMGRRGDDWAKQRLSDIYTSGLVDARRATVIAVPHVDGGLPVGGIVFAESAVDRLEERFTHWLLKGLPAGSTRNQGNLEVTPDSVIFTSGRANEEKWAVTTWSDGSMSVAVVPEPSIQFLLVSSLRAAADQLLPRVIQFYEVVLGFAGRVTFAFTMETERGPIRTKLEPVTLGTVNVDDVVKRAERAIDRAAGYFAWEPDPS
jgi:hypothetical protein